MVKVAGVFTYWSNDCQLDSSCGGSHNVLVIVKSHNALDGLDGYIGIFSDLCIGDMCRLFYITEILAPFVPVHTSCWNASAELPKPGAREAAIVRLGGLVMAYFQFVILIS